MPFAQYNRSGGGTFSRWTTNTPSAQDQKYDIGRINRQIENAQRRIEDAGYVRADADTRNWFEKATNLPEGQNALFDVLDLLQRPYQAIANPLSKSIRGEEQNVLESALTGLSGRERVRGTRIAEDLGIENPVLKGIVGTGLEIGLDPTTYIPGAAFAKGIQAAGKGVGAVGRGALNVAERVSPGLKTFREETAQPLLEKTREAFGRAFVPDYKLEETLTGTTDEAIKNLKQQTENRIRFGTEESTKNIADVAKLAGGVEKGADVGRIMEAPLRQVDEAGNLIERPARELSAEPAVRQAAETLIRSNTELRQWALDNGIGINELEGYMTHIWSAEERKRQKGMKVIPIDRGAFGLGQPNKKVLAQRKIPGSVEDINEQMMKSGRLKEGETFFEPNAFFASAIGQKRLIEYVNAVNFRRSALSNPNFAMKMEDFKQMDIPLPQNSVVINSNNYKFLKDDTAEQLGLKEEIGGEYVVTKSLKTALDRYQKLTTDEGINSFLKAFDSVQSAWKRLALFSVPYHLRNDIGAKFNNWVGGMSGNDLVKYSAAADVDVYNAVIKNQESPFYREFREQGLGHSGLSAVEFARRGVEPEEAIQRTIEKRSQFDQTLSGRLKAEAKQLKNPLNAFQTSQDFGQFIDQTNRFALYKWAREKMKMEPAQAAQKVREVQFDYTQLTPLEREVFARIIPFYRWMRNNLPFQIRSFINDPRKYAAVNKLRLSAQEATGINEENVPDWMKEQFAIPVYGEGGKGQFLGTNLPLSDLTRATSPMKMLLDAITPAAKLPAELALNRSFFYNKPIEKFAGQERKFAVPEDIYGIPVPGAGTPIGGIDQTLAYILEQIGGQPVRGAMRTLQAPTETDQDILFRDPALGISGLLKPFDTERAQYFQQVEQLKQLQDLINFIEQESGQRPRTIQEIR